MQALLAAPDACAGVHFISCQIPGLNRIDFAGLHPDARFTGLFVTPEMASSYSAGKVRFMPLSYSGMYRYLRSLTVDLALIQVAPGERDGQVSLASSAHFVPAVLERARMIVAELNETLPRPGRSVSIDAARLDHVVPADHPPLTLDAGQPSATAVRIGKHIAGLVGNGDRVQVGIGKVPSAVLGALRDHQRLVCHGGLINDAMIDLHEGGALDSGSPLVCTSVIGTKRLYDWIDNRSDVHVLPVSHTHDVRVMATIERLVAINSVLSIDLTGQANAETVDGRQVGGSGGLSDFVRGARLSKEGRSILALPSTAGRGKISRIVPSLDGDIASCPRVDADYVVTEHGVADLRHKSTDERADALIAVADPSFHDMLATAWTKRRKSGGIVSQ